MSSADITESVAAWLDRWPRRYGFALSTILLAGVAQYSLQVKAGITHPFLVFYPAILFVALYAGFWPALFSTFLAAAIIDLFFVPPRNLFNVAEIPEVIALILFCFMGFAVSCAVESSRKRAARLQEFERAVEGLEEMITVVDRDYRYLIANRAFLKYRQMQRCQLIGRTISEVLNTGVFESEVKPKLDECFTGKVVRFEMRYKYPQLGERELLLTYFPITGGGRIDRVACVLQDVTDQRNSDRAVSLFRTLIDHSNDAVEVVDPATLRFLDVNETACRVLGYTRSELLTMTVYDLDPNASESTCSRLLEQLRKGEAVLTEAVHRRKDGTIFPVEISIQLVQLDREYVIAVSRDITRRKKAELAARESEDRYRDLVEHSEDLVCAHDFEGKLFSVNPAPARALGYSVDELLKIPMRDFVAPEFREQFESYLKRIREKGSDHGLLCVVTKEGERRIWEYSNTVRTEGVAQPMVRGIAHDITERMKAERALRRSEERYRELVEQASDGIFVADRQGRCLDTNTAGAEMLGYTREEVLRLSMADVVAPEEVERIPAEITRSAGGATVRTEWTFQRKDGSLFPGELCGKQLPDGRMQAILRDMTERKRLEEEVRRSDQCFRVALTGSPITVFNQDCDLRYTWIYNPQLYWQHEALGKTDEEILGCQKATKLIAPKQKVLETGVAMREEVSICHDGKHHAFDMTIEPLFNRDGTVAGITGVCVDIARLRELADSLQDAKRRLAQEKSYLESEIETELGFEEIVGNSPALREVLQKARIVAPTDSTVLLLGETGTGKELMARSLHRLSSRKDGTFVKLNCAAVPSGLLESELFGHEKGAFTGAVSQKVGRIELADKGTLFLDEIGELPQELQPKLLRVLQDREFERLGSVHTKRVDVRIVSATNRDLRQDVADKKFREDLYYRLNVFPIELPPLRERREDIPLLVHHFVGKHVARLRKQKISIPDESMQILQNWGWPGNIRELENVLERMVILTKGSVLAAPPAELGDSENPLGDNLTHMERDHIIRVLRETEGILSGPEGAAVRLGLKRTTLQSMLRRFGIEAQEFRRGNGRSVH